MDITYIKIYILKSAMKVVNCVKKKAIIHIIIV